MKYFDRESSFSAAKFLIIVCGITLLICRAYLFFQNEN